MILGPQSRATSSFTRCWRPGVKAKWCRQSHRRSQQRRRAVETFERAPAAPIATPQLEESQSALVAEYDPQRLEDYFRQRSPLVAYRMAVVTGRALQWLAVVLGDRLDAAILGVKRTDHRAAQKLQEVACKLGPCFVKLAQTLSMRPDLIGETYAASLSELQDSVEPFCSEEALAILERELGRPVSEVFSYISQEPVASASLGQVYRGVLASTGQEVAVKVQRPGVEPTVALDVYLLRRGIGVAQKAAGITRDLRVVADEIGRSLFGELDFRLEAVHGEEFLAAHASLPFVTVPAVVRELTTRRVLVMEWVDGQSPTQLLPRSAGSASARQRILSMVRMGIQCSLSQLLVTGVMHGDPHSGNLLLTRDGRLCYLDHGMLVRVPEQHRSAMMCALIHMGLGEWRRLVDDLAALDLLKPGTDRAALAADLEREFSAVLSAQQGPPEVHAPVVEHQLPLLSLQSSALSFGTLTAVLFRVAFKYKFLLPPYFPLVVRSVASLEGVALLVDPSFKLVSAGMPIVLHQLLSDRRPAARQLLRELLLGPGGALRMDDAAQQIMQVWGRARQQEELLAEVPDGGLLASVDLWEGEGLGEGPGSGLDLAALLLDPANAPLRRVLMEANPAITVAGMSKPMLDTVRALAVDLLASADLAALRQGGGRSAAQRAQRRRLQLLLTASARRVAASPWGAILQLLGFTASVLGAVMSIKLRQGWAAFLDRVRQLLRWRGGTRGTGLEPGPAFA